MTAANFWSMIIKNKCSVIVMLCDIVEKGEVSNQLTPPILLPTILGNMLSVLAGNIRQ